MFSHTQKKKGIGGIGGFGVFGQSDPKKDNAIPGIGMTGFGMKPSISSIGLSKIQETSVAKPSTDTLPQS